MATQYDLIIIGAGTAAMVAAMRVRAEGWRVAVTDFRPFGGTCALRGCDPKKMLISGTSAIDHVQRMHDKGVAGDVHIDWQKLMAFKRSFTDPVPEKNEQRYRDKGIDIYHGRAQFTGKNSLDVDGQALEANYILLASGAEPVKLDIPGEEYLIDNEGFLSLSLSLSRHSPHASLWLEAVLSLPSSPTLPRALGQAIPFSKAANAYCKHLMRSWLAG